MPRKRRDVPWLQKRDGIYYVYWHDAEAKHVKRISLGASDPVEAQKRYANFLAQGHELFRGDKNKGLGVSDALDDYYREHVTTKVVDKVRQENAITHLKAWFKNEPLREIDIPACRAYADARRMGVIGGGRRCKVAVGSDSTIRRELHVLSAAAHHARRWKRIEHKDMPIFEMPSEPPAHDAPWLTRQELQDAIDKATGALKDFILIAYYTGARRTSVEQLQKSQINLATSRINLRSPTESVLQRTSKKRRPIIPIDPKIRPTLERLLNASETEWLFGTNKDMYRVFHKHMVAIGLSGKAHPHILRHTRATHLLQDRVSIYDVARLLGDTVATVERVYGHHSPELLAEAIRQPELRIVQSR